MRRRACSDTLSCGKITEEASRDETPSPRSDAIGWKRTDDDRKYLVQWQLRGLCRKRARRAGQAFPRRLTICPMADSGRSENALSTWTSRTIDTRCRKSYKKHLRSSWNGERKAYAGNRPPSDLRALMRDIDHTAGDVCTLPSPLSPTSERTFEALGWLRD